MRSIPARRSKESRLPDLTTPARQTSFPFVHITFTLSVLARHIFSSGRQPKIVLPKLPLSHSSLPWPQSWWRRRSSLHPFLLDLFGHDNSLLICIALRGFCIKPIFSITFLETQGRRSLSRRDGQSRLPALHFCRNTPGVNRTFPTAVLSRLLLTASRRACKLLHHQQGCASAERSTSSPHQHSIHFGRPRLFEFDCTSLELPAFCTLKRSTCARCPKPLPIPRELALSSLILSIPFSIPL